MPWRRRTTTWPRRRNSRWRATAARCTGGCSCTGWWMPSWWVAGPAAGTRDRESRCGVHEGGCAFRKTEDFVRLRRQQARVIGLALTHSCRICRGGDRAGRVGRPPGGPLHLLLAALPTQPPGVGRESTTLTARAGWGRVSCPEPTFQAGTQARHPEGSAGGAASGTRCQTPGSVPPSNSVVSDSFLGLFVPRFPHPIHGGENREPQVRSSAWSACSWPSTWPPLSPLHSFR